MAAEPSDAVCWRNLGVASHNIEDDADAAMSCFDQAMAAAPDDARLLYERDQLARRVGESPSPRLAHLLKRLDLVRQTQRPHRRARRAVRPGRRCGPRP